MSKQTERRSGNDDVVAQYHEYLMPVWKSLNVPIRRAEGCTVEDFDGNEYLDIFSGIAVTNVGHRNEGVVDAARAQLDEFVHGCSYVHPNQPVADLAERLAEITPGDLRKTFFCNSGTEAVEGAIKLARSYTGSTEIVSLEMGFHGRTYGSLALTANKAYRDGVGPTLNDVAQTAPPYEYRCPICEGDCVGSGRRCTDQLERVIDSHTNGDLAAVVVEPVMGEGGIVVPPEGWLEDVREIAREHDALLVVDEVQSGYGRTGEFWASDHFDVEPDILTQAKGIANGLPLGAFIAKTEVADAFGAGDHLSTFGGNPVSCAAALATIDELQDGIVDDAAERGARLTDRLAELEAEFDVVGDTRGLGLMQGVELVDPDTEGPFGVAPGPAPDLAKHVADRLREDHSVVMGVGGFYSNVMRFQPPLTISGDQLETAVGALRASLAAEVER